MNAYRTEGWARKMADTQPSAFSTCYKEYGSFAKPPLQGWVKTDDAADSTDRGARRQAAASRVLAHPRRPEDYDDIRLLLYPDYYQTAPLAEYPRSSRRTDPFRRRAHPGVRLPPVESEKVAPVHYPSQNYHIRNHLAHNGECLCSFPARPYKDAGAGDPRDLHPVTGRSYKGAPLTWCHYHPRKRKQKPSINNRIFNTTFRSPWLHSYMSSKIE